MKYLTTVLAVVAVATVGCDMSKIDPGGGASAPSVVSLRGSGGLDLGSGAGGGTGGGTVVESGPPGTLVGRIVLDGDAPALNALVGQGQSSVDPTICAADGAIVDESLQVSADGGLANVFVYLSKAPEGDFATSESQKVLDQKACVFLPHALVWRSGVPVQLINSDGTSHNVSITTNKNGNSNSTMPPGTSSEMTFKRPEPLPFKATCSIHSWMSFYALVVDHPFAAVTDADGKFQIANLPSGVEYTFRVWHEKGSRAGRKWKVVVNPGPDLTNVELQYTASDLGL